MEEFSLDTGNDPLSALALHADGRLLFVGTIKGNVMIWDLEKRVVKRTFRAHDQGIEALALTLDGQSLLSVSDDQKLKKWDIDVGRVSKKFKVSKTFERLLLYGRFHRILNFFRSPKLIFSLDGYEDSASLAQAEGDEERLFIRQTSSERMRDIVVTPNGQHAITGASNGSISIWDIKEGHLESNFKNSTNGINSVCISADGKYIAAATGTPHSQSDNSVRLWATDTRRMLAYFVGDAPMSACAFTTDSKRLVVGDTLGRVLFLEICEGGLLQPVERRL